MTTPPPARCVLCGGFITAAVREALLELGLRPADLPTNVHLGCWEKEQRERRVGT